MKKLIVALLIVLFTVTASGADEPKAKTSAQAMKEMEYRQAIERLPDSDVEALFHAFIKEGVKPIDAADRAAKIYREKEAELDKRIGPKPNRAEVFRPWGTTTTLPAWLY